MKVLVVGGGSGGHVTPALAILEALKKQEPKLEVCFVCDKKFAPQAQTILAQATMPIQFKTIQAGKFRRYHNVALWRQLLDIPTVLLNIRDFFLIGIGVLQSLRLLARFRPDVVFGKGGFVCMPVGIAAHLKKIPMVLHDSDAHPGLTNRLLAPWATAIATGAPLENYNYNKAISSFVGIPVSTEFHAVSAQEQQKLKQTFVQDAQRPLVAVVGGGLGAKPINDAMVRSAPALIKAGLEVVHVAGAAHAKTIKQQVSAALDSNQVKFYHVEAFISGAKMAVLLKAADIIVSRGGATAMAELSLVQKPVILIPSPRLTGGQQLKNAQSFTKAEAIITVDDPAMQANSTILEHAILDLAANKTKQAQLAANIAAFAQPKAAEQVADLISKAAGQGREK